MFINKPKLEAVRMDHAASSSRSSVSEEFPMPPPRRFRRRELELQVDLAKHHRDRRPIAILLQSRLPVQWRKPYSAAF